MRILTLIPARGGSKRIPGKNLRRLGNKPLINWTIDSALCTPDLSEIIVSTDDPMIAKIAESAGASVPWLRPKELATDDASSVDVALHALDWFEEANGVVDGVLLLQPTSPFRTCETIQKAINLYQDHDDSTIIGVSPTRDHPMYALVKKGESLVPYVQQNDFKFRSQDLPEIYSVNGSIYLISPSVLRTTHSFFDSKMLPVITNSPFEAIDIDTESDFKFAELITGMFS
jgi:N-acylneuraminate cytidylyltransferase